jgi:hypothetical protein
MLDRNGSHTKPELHIPEFSDEFVQRLADALPEPLTQQRRELLPHILRDWACNDLRQHLSWDSRDQQLRLISKRAEVGIECVRQMNVLYDLEQAERKRMVARLFDAQGRGFDNGFNCPSRTEFANELKRLTDALDCLAEYAAIEPSRRKRRGRRQNVPANYVLRDAAAIFEWFGGTEATREVDRDTGKDTGPFYNFSSTLWPVLFGNGVAGLSSAMKNWAPWRHRERSALLGHIKLRHPTWGIFDR